MRSGNSMDESSDPPLLNFRPAGTLTILNTSQLFRTDQSSHQQFQWHNHHTDATLTAITKHASSFTELDSLVAVSKHSNLNMVDLAMAESVSVETLYGLLLDEKKSQINYCQTGSCNGLALLKKDVSKFMEPYNFNTRHHDWTKRKKAY
eukprot:scaffold176_cov175-Ochromonas_danica.AAC.2